MLRHRNIQLETTLQTQRNSEKEAEVERRVKEAEDSYLLQAEKVRINQAMKFIFNDDIVNYVT